MLLGNSSQSFGAHTGQGRVVAHVINTQRGSEDIVFIEVDAKPVHHPHTYALVIIVRMANGNVHRMLVDNGSVIDILY